MPIIKDKIKVPTKDRAEIAYKYYLTQGWTPEQASGIVGSLITESGNFSEDVINGTRKGDGGKAFGIAQWHPDRQAKAQSLYGDGWKDFNNQLKFVQWELTNTEKEAGNLLKATKGVWQAGTIFANKYERPALKFNADDKRQANVADAYRKYGKNVLTEEDRKAFTDYNNNVIQIKTPTSNLTNFELPQNNTTFADVPDVYKEEKEAEVDDAKKQLAESSFIEDYQQAQQEQYQQQIDEQPTPIMKTDVYGIAQNVENAVSGGVAQQGGNIIKDNNGYWNPANQGKIVQIDGGNITMKNVYEPLIGISDKGEKQYMLPGQNYNFKNANFVTEYPTITDKERAFIEQYKNKIE